MNTSNLIIENYTDKYGPHKCDGCGREFIVGEKVINGIESCCGGGCWRMLCSNCIKIAYALIHSNIIPAQFTEKENHGKSKQETE